MCTCNTVHTCTSVHLFNLVTINVTTGHVHVSSEKQIHVHVSSHYNDS